MIYLNFQCIYVCCVIRQGMHFKYLHCLALPTRHCVQAYAGSSFAMDCCPIQRESMTNPINRTFETWDEHLPYKYIYMCLHCSEMYFINSAHIKDNHKTKQSVVWELKSLTLFFFQAEQNNKILLSWLAIASSNCWG